MTECLYQKAIQDACAQVSEILLRPMPKDCHSMGIVGEFDPWDVFPSLYGSYDSEFDRLAIEVLSDVMNGTRKRDDLAGDMFREMLCSLDLCDYGTSPRFCFPNKEFRKLLPELIARWRTYSIISWGNYSSP